MNPRLPSPACLALFFAAAAPAAAQSHFEPEVTLLEGRPAVVDVIAGDFTGNGESDMLLFNSGMDGFHIIEGRAQGGFSFPMPAELTAGGVLSLAETGDFDVDGHLDFAAILNDGFSPSLVTVLQRPGNPWQVVVVDASPGPIEQIAIGDFGGDGEPDIFVLDSNAQIRGYRNVSGSYSPTIFVSQGASQLSVMNLYVQSSADVVYFNTTLNQWRIFITSSNWTTLNSTPLLPTQIGSYESLAMGDLDGDGATDLMLEVPAGGPFQQDQLIVLENRNSPPFDLGFGTPFSVPTPLTAGQGDLRLVDVNGDGLADPVYTPGTLPANAGDTVVQLNQGAYAFDAPRPLLNGPNALLDNAKYLDANGDDRVDIWTPEQLYTHQGGTTGPWFLIEDAVDLFPLPSSLGTPFMLDVDQDGDLDIAVPGDSLTDAGILTQKIYWLENFGALRFSIPRLLFPRRVLGRLAGIGDFDGNGIHDLLLTQSGSQQRAVVRFGLGGGQYSTDVVAGSTSTARYHEYVILDRNGDGSDEIIANLDMLPGTSIVELAFIAQGTPFAETPLLSATSSSNLVLADFNSDGLGDITLSTLLGTSIALGVPGGSFGPLTQFNGPSFAVVTPFALDVDQDGDDDLVTRSSTYTLGWAESIYPFGMTPLVAFPDPVVAGFRGFSAADVNGDGLNDIIGTGNRLAGAPSVEVFLAQPGGPFMAPQVAVTGTDFVAGDAQKPLTVDVDSDGDLDLITITELTRQVVLAENNTVSQAGGADPGCMTGNVNSTGRSGEVVGYGSDSVASMDLRLTAIQLPENVFGFFVGSQTPQSPLAVPGSAGAICLGGSIGRYDAPGQIKNSGAGGTFTIDLDPSALEVGTGQVPAVAGQAWYFQAWHRDALPQGATSNLTNSRRIVFTP